MIIVRLMGGLGNQMFQYAAARRLAYANEAQLKLDVRWFKNNGEIDTLRNYALNKLNIKEDFASSSEIRKYVRKDPRKTMGRILTYSPFSKRSFILEKHYHFDPSVLRLHDNVYLEGYWQSEMYFKDIEGIIREEFSFRVEMDALNRQIAETIRNTNSVSIHVRRGDYVSNQATSLFHGTCSLDYYRLSIEKITARVKDPHFFVFSDDPPWVKENLKLAHTASFIGHNEQKKGHEDMRLMSLCRHHIIANSTLSWWGAWLCMNPEKIVIAPAEWFRNKEIDASDLLPERWIRI